MKIFSGPRYAADTDWSPLFDIPKWADGNTIGEAFYAPIILPATVTAYSGNSFQSVTSRRIMVKAWNTGGAAYATITGDRGATDGLTIALEDAGTVWRVIVADVAIGTTVRVEFDDTATIGFVTPTSNRPFKYTPTGGLSKPYSTAQTVSGSTNGTANSWIKVATIVTSAAYERYSALLAIQDVEGSAQTLIMTLQVNRAGSAPAGFSAREVTNWNAKPFEVYWTTATVGAVTTIDLWVKSLVTYSTVAVTVLSEATSNVTTKPAVLMRSGQAWTTSAPGGATRISNQHRESSLTFSNGWTALSGFGGITGNGVVQVDRICHLHVTAQAGTLTGNTVVATLDSQCYPQSTVSAMALVVKADGSYVVTRVSIYTNGQITLIGDVPAGSTSIHLSATWHSVY